MKFVAIIAFAFSIMAGMIVGALLMKEHTGYSRHYHQILRYYSFPVGNSFAEPLDLPCFHGSCTVSNRVAEIDDLIDIPLMITSFPSFSYSPSFRNSSILSYLKYFENELRTVDKDERVSVRNNIHTILDNDEPCPAESLRRYMMTYNSFDEE